MCKKTLFLLAVLGLVLSSAVQAANITVVTENVDREPDGVVDDQGLIDWLVAAGHAVDVQRDYWWTLDDAKIAALNAADLVIISRLSNSGNYDDGAEVTQWNSITAPMLQLSAYLVRNSRWKWMDTGTASNNTTDTVMEVLDPTHELFAGVTLSTADPNDPNVVANLVSVIDPNVGTGMTSFMGTLDPGNGTLLATAPASGMAWIVEWDKGVEYYDGAGQFAGGPRLYFAVGTQESGATPQGAWNLTAEGEIMFANAINYMLSIPSRYASAPSPAEGAGDLLRDEVTLGWTAGTTAATHDVYLGTSLEAVASGSTDSNDTTGTLVSASQTGNSFDPGRLEFGQTYYWRVDEVGAAPNYKVYKGDVWSFTVEPYSVPITNVTATASSSEGDLFGPEKTVDGSGLENDLHSANGTTMWLSSGDPDEVVYIEYAFDKPYRLDMVWVWNSNTGIESMYGYGLKDVTIETSMDGATWTTFGDVEFAQAPGDYGYAHDTVDMAATAAKYVRFVANSNWGGGPRYGLSEVRFFAIPVRAREPQPVSGQVEVPVNGTLSWRSGLLVGSHQLYLSSNKAAVENGTALVKTLNTNSFNLESLGLNIGTTYYWKVNEVNDVFSPKALDGDVWSFTTQNFFAVDDFESYTSANIKNTWVDGWKKSTGVRNASNVDPVIDQEVANSGNQSVFLAYDNSTSPYHIEIERTISGRTNWTNNGVQKLVLFFHGDPGNNASDKLYVTINGKTATYGGDLSKPWWRNWSIDLNSMNINIRDVKLLAVGVGDVSMPTGRKGKIWIDDIRLYRTAPSVPTIVDAALAVNSSGDFKGQFDTLLAAMSKADPAILEALSSEEDYTVFAPTDDAFAAMGINAGNVGSLDTGILNEILLYHVVAGKLASADVLAASQIATVQGTAIRQADGVLTDGVGRQANLLAVDGVASNGLMHVVDAMMLPFEIRSIVEMLVATNSAGDLAGQLDELIGIAQSNPSLLALLTGADEYTVFAPTDAAIAALRLGADENLLMYHIAAGSLLAADVLATEELTMLNGGTLKQAGGVLIDAAGRQVAIVATDILAANGVIHVIDAVLLPVPVIENASFELPGTEKQKGFDAVPGWATDANVVDSGVETGYTATDGEWTAYLMSGDPSVWQMTPLTLGQGDLFTLKVDARITWAATTMRMTLYYLADGVRVPAATADVALTDAMQEYALELNAYLAPDAVGKTIGIEFENVSEGASWIGLDNVRLEGPTAAPEPEPEPEPAAEPEPEPVVVE
jgi:uncharacterized surface protein with fasciclin (FAS1) repeats